MHNKVPNYNIIFANKQKHTHTHNIYPSYKGKSKKKTNNEFIIIGGSIYIYIYIYIYCSFYKDIILWGHVDDGCSQLWSPKKTEVCNILTLIGCEI